MYINVNGADYMPITDRTRQKNEDPTVSELNV